MNELSDKATRFVVVEDVSAGGRPVGFCQFGFTLQGDVLDQFEGLPVLKVFNLALLDQAQRKGVGQRMMQLMEMIARKQNMAYVQCMVTKKQKAAVKFFKKKLKGYEVDNVASYCQVEAEDLEELDTFHVFSKNLDPASIKKIAPKDKLAAVEEAAEQAAAALEALQVD